MSLAIRTKVNEERREKLDKIDKNVDANKTTIQQRIMDKGIDDLYDSIFDSNGALAKLNGDSNV